MPNFQEQAAKDLDAAFFNTPKKEFVTKHKIAGIRGDRASSTKILEVVVDKELYKERTMKDQVENITLNGLVFFVKEEHWLKNFPRIPKIRDGLMFDNEQYQILDIDRDFGVLEFTIEANRGM